MARVRAIMLAVVLGPKTIESGSAPSSSPMVALTVSTRSSQAAAAAKEPWELALFPLRCQAADASMATSTT